MALQYLLSTCSCCLVKTSSLAATAVKCSPLTLAGTLTGDSFVQSTKHFDPAYFGDNGLCMKDSYLLCFDWIGVTIVLLSSTIEKPKLLSSHATINDMEQSAVSACAHEEGYVCAFVSPSTQQIESHDAHILLDLCEETV